MIVENGKIIAAGLQIQRSGQIEKGKVNITIKTLEKLLEIHEISIEHFFEIDI